MKELERNVALRVSPVPGSDAYSVSGRGLLHLSVLIETMRREGYELSVGKPQVILLGTGSEVTLCVEAYERLQKDGIQARVVSMPSWELFEKQSKDYREQVLPSAILARVAVEQASAFGWAQYVGMTGAVIGMKSFGTSAPFQHLQKRFGFTVENIVAAARAQLAR